jgi:hypothetical protein
MLRLLSLTATLLAIASRSLSAQDSAVPHDIQLTLPPIGYAVAGAEMSVYFDNIVLTQHPENYRFVVDSDLGKTEANRWSVIASAEQVGDHAWKVAVFDGNQKLAEQSMTWHVTPASLSAGRGLTLLIVGDSLTHATIYPNDLARRLSAPGQPTWSMLGTHRPASAQPGVAHEGYGGWTWQRFVTHYEPNPDPAQRKHSSPFVFLENDQPKLDVPRYFRDSCDGKTPDVVTFLLGINDCFGANPNDPAAMDQRIDQVFAQAETMLKAFREAAPHAELAVCLTTPPNARESGFEANYKGKYTRWGWKRIQHRLVQRQLKQFGGREAEGIFVVPTELNLDPVAGYPVDNGVHPNAAGYQQVAASLHAWLMGQMGRMK